MNGSTYVILILGSLILFAAAAGIAIFMAQRLLNPDPSPTRTRLGKIKKAKRENDDYIENETARKLASLVKGSDYKNIKLGRYLEKYAYIQKLKRSLGQANIKTPVDQYFLKWYIIPFLASVFLAMVTKFFPIFFLGVVIIAFAHFSVNFRKKKRLHKFTTQFPDALNLMTSSLRAGHSFQSALAVVASELQDPIGSEFSQVVKDFNLGVPVRDALGRLTISLDNLPDIRMFATAVLIQRESGGNLAEILDQLSYTIRERFKLKGQISSMTAQSRLTGYCLGAAPFVVTTILVLIAPQYIQPMFDDTLGRIALLVAFIMQLIGFFVIKRIVDIRV
ncbi:MAG: type II secretion system F family protein [Vampirovibrionales bacterium]|nr:type II secretion system F family protein [Vampirovibrionales bacterium]